MRMPAPTDVCSLPSRFQRFHYNQCCVILLLQVEGEWQDVTGSLSVVPSLQPLLVLRVVKNGCKEASALGACLHTLSDERALDREEAKTNKQKCQVKWSGQVMGVWLTTG